MKKKSLEGVRVLDFTWSVSGSTTARILAALGAEVIKVEWPKSPDYMRFAFFAKGDKPTIDNGAFFNNLNAGKLGISLNAKSPQGMELVHELLSVSDIVLENFSTGVFEKWGLTYENLDKISPGIIYMSISGLGHTGRNRKYGTWGPTAQALSGMTFTSGLPNKHPAGWGFSYLDYIAGYKGAFSVLAALRHKRETGEGQHIDISQVEAGIDLTGANILDYTVNNRSSYRPEFPSGNRSVSSKENSSNTYRGRDACPHNTYRCKGGGENDWCTIAIFNDEEWHKLVDVMGYPEWTKFEKFSTFEGRVEFQDELDARIERFTMKYDKHELMMLLQENGIAAGAVQTSSELLDSDSQLENRQLFERLDHSLLGTRRFEGLPIKMSKSCTKLSKAAPLLGESNAYVFGEILGYSKEEIEKFHAKGILWPNDIDVDSLNEDLQPLW